MAERYSEQKRHKIRTFSVGDNINVRIHHIDHTSTDLQHMPCKVLEAVGKTQAVYRLCCKGGVLNTCYHSGDLEPFEALLVYRWKDGRMSQKYPSEKQLAYKRRGISSLRTSHCHHGDAYGKIGSSNKNNQAPKAEGSSKGHEERQLKKETGNSDNELE